MVTVTSLSPMTYMYLMNLPALFFKQHIHTCSVILPSNKPNEPNTKILATITVSYFNKIQNGAVRLLGVINQIQYKPIKRLMARNEQKKHEIPSKD